jgi:coiled-coil domain-containing protein 39
MAAASATGGGYDAGVDVLPLHLMNDTNKQLSSQIAHYEAEVDKSAMESDDHRDRLKFMQDHLGNVKAEILNTQALYEAKRREVQSEDHMCQLAERERGRLKQHLANLEILKSEVQEKLDAVQNRIFQGNLRMDEFKAAMNFNQEELEQWDLARKQKEDDGSVIQRYTKADEAKMRDLTFTVEKLSKQAQRKRDELEEEVTATRAAQMELDKSAEDYKVVHQERQYLLQQWEEAVKAMHLRDNAIKAAGDRYQEGKQWLQKRANQLKARAEFHELEVNNTAELRSKISQEERVLSKYREDFGVLEKHLRDLDDEVDVVRNTLSKAQSDKSHLSAKHESLNTKRADKIAQFERMQKQHEQVMHKLQEELEAATDLERQNALVAELLQQTEQSRKALEKEMARIKDEQYHSSEKLHEVRRQQANYLAEISGAQSQGRNMNAKIAQLDGEGFRQQELLYTIEFNVQQMERKVNRAKGERTEEEKRELQEKIEMLQKMYEDLGKQHNVLETQVKRVHEELRQTRHDTNRLEKEKKTTNDRLLELTLENESCTIELGKMTKVKDENLVQADVLKLQVERLKKLLGMRGGELMGLENRKEQLAITIAEREEEIAMHHEILRMEAKTAEDERRAIAAELVDRAKQVGQLKNRFEVLMGRMDKEAGQMTHAQHIVKTAKEREELQTYGDSLDVNIKKAERELRKIDKTIAILRGSNSKFKHQFTKVTDGDDALVQQKLLQQKNKELQAIINRRTNEMKEFLRTEVAKMSELQDRQNERAELEAGIGQIEEQRVALHKEIEEQRELVARYDVAIGKARRTTESEIVQDIELLEEEEKQASIVRLLMLVAQNHGEDVYRVIEGTLHRNGIEIPVDAGDDGDA